MARRKKDVESDDDDDKAEKGDSNDDSDSEDDIEGEGTTAKKSSKKAKLSSKKKINNQKAALSSLSVNEKKQKLLKQAKRDAKTEFEKMKVDILNEIPKKYKNMFGQIGFTKWSKSTVPVLIMSPFSVPPGAVRTTWLNMYEKMLTTMSYLIYWYGAVSDSSMFGFIAQSAFTPYAEEVAKGSKGSHLLNPKLQEKVKAGAALNAGDKEKVNSYKEVEEDLKLEPSERKRGILDFKEGFDLLGIEDVDEFASFDDDSQNDEVDANSVSSDDGEELSEASSVLQKKKQQKSKDVATKAIAKKEKKGKKIPDNDKVDDLDVISPDSTNVSNKRRRGSLDSKDEQGLEEVSETKPGKGKRGRKKDIKEVKEELDDGIGSQKASKRTNSKAGKKRNSVEIDGDAMEENQAEDVKKNGKKKKMEENQAEDVKKNGKKKKKLDEVDKKTVEAAEDDEDELDTSDNGKRRSGRLSINDTKFDSETKTKVKSTKKERKIVLEISKNVALYDKPDVDNDDEQKVFEECERKYLAKINRWTECVTESDSIGLEAILVDLVKIVDKFSAPFVQSYDILGLIKLTEGAATPSSVPVFKLLKSNLFLAFAKKKPLIPKNFTPVLGRVPIKGLDDASTVAEQEEPVQVEVEPLESNEIKADADEIIEEESPSKSEKPKRDKQDSETDAKEDDERELVFDEDDGKDADFSGEDEASSDEEMKISGKDNDDEMNEDDDSSNNEGKRTKQSKKDMPKKKGKISKFKVEKVMSERGKTLKEHRAFKISQQRFLPIVERWKLSLETENLKELKGLIEEVPGVVEEFSATFIKVYGLPDLLKGTKQLFKKENEDLTAWSSLREKLKICYSEKSSLVPEGFTPKMIDGDGPIYKLESKKDEIVTVKSESHVEPRSPVRVTETPKNDSITRNLSSNNLDPGTKKASLTDVKTELKSNTNRQPSAAVPLKPERKKFSLTSLMKPSSKELDSTSKESDAARNTANTTSNSVSNVKLEKKPMPSWIKDPPSIEAPKDDPRLFALEFLSQMASQFPIGKINIDSVARSIEVAIFNWANTNNNNKNDDASWSRKYWSKIHAIVAAVCGKRDNGTLMNLIWKGQFDAPEKLMELSDDDLMASFEGKPLNL